MSWSWRGVAKIALTSLERVVGFVSGFDRELAFNTTSSCWHPSISLSGCPLAMAMALLGRW